MRCAFDEQTRGHTGFLYGDSFNRISFPSLENEYLFLIPFTVFRYPTILITYETFNYSK